MTDHSISKQADSLLRQLPRRRDEPHYTDDGFRCKLRNAAKNERRKPVRRLPETQHYLIQREWADILKAAKLTCRQLEVVRFRMAGKTFEEIGAMSGCSKQAILNILTQARKKIEAARCVYPYAQLAEIYREETRRKGSRPGRGRIFH